MSFSALDGLSMPSTGVGTRAFAANFGGARGPKSAASDDALSPMDQARRTSQQEFASLLSQSVAARSGSKVTSEMTPAEKEAQARTAAEDFVAVAFVQPIFKNLRGSHMGPELPPPLGPGPGEKQFRSLADTQVAKQLVHASNWPLVDSLTRKLLSGRGSIPGSAESFTNAPVLPGSLADLNQRKAERAAAATAKLAATSQEAVK